MDEQDGGLQEELELLEAIYLEELSVERAGSGEVRKVTVQINPATGDNEEERYVCLTLEFGIPLNYPEVVPEMVIRNPRGLADDHVTKLRANLNRLALERAGAPMLYELIELGKETLTESNVPHGQCVICLEYFAKGEPFTKTECYHHFHCTCLLRYVEHCKEEHDREREEIRQHKHMTHQAKQIVCPVCREAIEYDLTYLKAQTSGKVDMEDKVVLSDDIRKLQRNMAELFNRQKSKGGIIDVEAERNKFLIPSESLADAPYTPSPQNLFSHGPRSATSDGHDLDRNKSRGGRLFPRHHHHQHQHPSGGASKHVGSHDKPSHRDQRKDQRQENSTSSVSSSSSSSSSDSRNRDRRQHGGRDKRKEEKNSAAERYQRNDRNSSLEGEEEKAIPREDVLRGGSKLNQDGLKDTSCRPSSAPGERLKRTETNGDVGGGEEGDKNGPNNRSERYRKDPRDQKQQRRRGPIRDDGSSDHSNWSSQDGEESAGIHDNRREPGGHGGHPGRRWTGRGRGRGGLYRPSSSHHQQHQHQENGENKTVDNLVGDGLHSQGEKQKFNQRNRSNNYQKNHSRGARYHDGQHHHGNNYDKSFEGGRQQQQQYQNYHSGGNNVEDCSRWTDDHQKLHKTRPPPPGFSERSRSDGPAPPGFKVGMPPRLNNDGQGQRRESRPRPPPGFEERR